MKNIILSAILLLLITATGCLNDSTTKIQTPTAPEQPAAPVNNNSNTNNTPVTPVATSTPAPAAPAIVPASKSGSTAGLNPAHGQPGHRCEIAVGAPLDSKPVQPAIQSQATPPKVVAQPVVVPQPTAAGLNPAHGQPGHRCDIAVGAPLGSKPVQ